VILPALRERRADIPLLVDHFLRKLSARTGKTISSVSEAALDTLQAYDFPGNIRELENGLHRAFVMCRGPQIDVEHLPAEWSHSTNHRPRVPDSAPPATAPQPARLPGAASTAERAEILKALEAHKWNRSAAARALGIARNTLWRKMKACGIED